MEIIKIYNDNSSYYNQVIELLTNEFDYKNRGKRYWIRRFEKSQLIGVGMVVENKVVGFLGTLERSEKIIGLSVWYINPHFRKYSIKFITQSLKHLDDKSIVNSSPNPTALKVFKRLEGFNHSIEYVGIPKTIINFRKITSFKIHSFERLDITTDENWSIYHILIYYLRHRRLCLSLKESNDFIYCKKINVLHKNLNYIYPSSIYGDIFE